MIKWSASAILLLVIFFGALLSPIFKVSKVKVSPSQPCLTEQQAFNDSEAQGKNIFLIKKSQIVSELSQKHPCIKNLKVKKQFPKTLLFEIETVDVVAKVENSNFYLTEKGELVDGNFGDKLTLYFPHDALAAGQKIENSQTLFALKMAASIAKSDFSANQVRIIDENQIVAYNQHDQIVVFTSAKDAAFQVDSLQLVLSKAKIDGTKIAKIDLRFANPVVTYK